MIDQNDPRLTAYVLGELSSAEAAEIENAIESSSEVAAAVEDVRGMIGLLDGAYTGEEKLSLSSDQKKELKMQPAALPTDEWRRWVAVAIAASLAFVVFGGWSIVSDYFNSEIRRLPVAKHDLLVEGLDELEPSEMVVEYPDTDEWADKEADRSKYLGVRLRGGVDHVGDLDLDGVIAEGGVTIDEFKSVVPLVQSAVELEQDYLAVANAADETVSPLRGHSILDDTYSMHDRRLEELSGVQGQVGPRPLSQNSNGRILGGSVSGKLDQGVPLNERELDEAIKSALAIEGSGILDMGRVEKGRNMTMAVFGDLESLERELTKMESIQSLEEMQTKVGELTQQQRLWHESDRRKYVSEVAAMRMQILEAQSKAEAENQRVGSGHPAYESSVAQVEVLEKQLAELEKEQHESAQSVEEIPDEVLFERHKKKLEERIDQLKAEAAAEQTHLQERLPEIEDRMKNLARERQAVLAAKGEQSRIDERLAEIDGDIAKLKKEISRIRGKAEAKPKSWKRVKAIPNTTRLMVGDKEELTLNGMQVNAQVDGFRARVLVDYFYYNDRESRLEGNFKLRLPDDASLYYFAFGESVYEFSNGKLADKEFMQDGTQFVSLGAPDVKQARKGQWDNVKEARMVPKEKAAHAFRETVRRRIDPALVEWSGAGVFSAKVFPLSPRKLHRIVVGYDVNLKQTDDGLNFELALPEQPGQCRVEVNVQEIEGVTYTASPQVDPVPGELDGKLQKRFVFDNDEENLSSVTIGVKGASDALLRSENEQGDFWTTQVTPDLPSETAESNSRAIFLVDTSLSSAPDKFNAWLQMLEATLNNNRDSLKEFDVLFFNVDGHFWKGKYAENTPDNVAALKADMQQVALEGATDLYAAIESVTKADWIGDAKNRPDLFLLSDGAATWGETDLRLINELLKQPQLGSLFAYQTGLTGTAISNLRFLAGQSGGAVFSVATEDEIKTASTAHRNRPWQLRSITADGATDILTAGRVEWVYPGQTITVVGRGNVDATVQLTLQQGNKSKVVSHKPKTIESELASRMYGHVAVGQLESLGEKVFDVSAAYARHFRITGQTCSLLMLESEEDYLRFDIKPQEDLFVVKAKSTSKLVRETLEKHAASLSDPKARLLTWLERLESMPGMKFKIPTALQLALDDIKVEAVSHPMDCSLTKTDSFSESYANAIKEEQLNYDTISIEARRRLKISADDSIKVYSSLIERNPGDIITARDVAFTAMELERPAAAFHLLRRVAMARPFQGNIYPAIGQCLTQLGKADMAIVYYEIAMNGTFQRQGKEFKQIVAAEYMHLLRQIVSGKLESSVKDFAQARLETLGKHLPFGTADLLVTMMWNQDQTDVDLHVTEPSGEECCYSHKHTKSDGHITSDITTGFGPEMYFNANAPCGKYQVQAKFYSNSQNRTSTRNKVYMTIIRGFGTDDESITRKTIPLRTVGKKEQVMTLGIE